jgi:hypothetical protein
VHAGSFTVNGVQIDVASEDTVNSVLARITASDAGVSAAYDDVTQTVKLTSTRDGAGPIVVGDDTSGFLAAVKLDGTAESTTGTGTTSSFDAALASMAEYASVHAGTVTVNGHDIAIDPASTTVRGLVAALGGIDGLDASLDESTGVITLSAARKGESIDVSDTSGVLGALGIATGVYRGTSSAARPVKTRTGSLTVTNASAVADDVSAVAKTVNEALSLLRSGASPQLQSDIESKLQATLDALRKAGVDGVRWTSGAGQPGLSVDRDRLVAALASLVGSDGHLVAATGTALEGLTAAIGALAAPPPPPAPEPETRESLRSALRDELKTTVLAHPPSAASLLVASLMPGQDDPRRAIAYAATPYAIGRSRPAQNGRAPFGQGPRGSAGTAPWPEEPGASALVDAVFPGLSGAGFLTSLRRWRA